MYYIYVINTDMPANSRALFEIIILDRPVLSSSLTQMAACRQIEVRLEVRIANRPLPHRVIHVAGTVQKAICKLVTIHARSKSRKDDA